MASVSPLRAGFFFTPIIDTTRKRTGCRGTFETTPSRPVLQGVLVHLRDHRSRSSRLDWISVSKTIFLRRALRSSSGSFSRVVTVEGKSKMKATITILLEPPLSSFCYTEKSVVPSFAGITTSPSMIADPAPMLPCVGCDLSETIGPVVTTPGVNTLMAASLRWTWTPITIELDLRESSVLPDGTLSIDVCQRRFD